MHGYFWMFFGYRKANCSLAYFRMDHTSTVAVTLFKTQLVDYACGPNLTVKSYNFSS